MCCHSRAGDAQKGLSWVGCVQLSWKVRVGRKHSTPRQAQVEHSLPQCSLTSSGWLLGPCELCPCEHWGREAEGCSSISGSLGDTEGVVSLAAFLRSPWAVEWWHASAVHRLISLFLEFWQNRVNILFISLAFPRPTVFK